MSIIADLHSRLATSQVETAKAVYQARQFTLYGSKFRVESLEGQSSVVDVIHWSKDKVHVKDSFGKEAIVLRSQIVKFDIAHQKTSNDMLLTAIVATVFLNIFFILLYFTYS